MDSQTEIKASNNHVFPVTTLTQVLKQQLKTSHTQALCVADKHFLQYSRVETMWLLVIMIINPLGKGRVDFPNLLNVVNLNQEVMTCQLVTFPLCKYLATVLAEGLL